MLAGLVLVAGCAWRLPPDVPALAVSAALPGSAAQGAAHTSERPTIVVRLLAFTDFHGHLQASEGGTLDLPDPDKPGATLRAGVGGAAYLGSLIAQRRAQNPNTLVLSAGDLVGASRLSSALFRDESTIEAMNLIGLDANVVGNHEFDKGRVELDRLVKGGCAVAAADDTLASCAGPGGTYAGARFAFLAANVIDGSGQSIHPPTLIKQFGPVRVAVIGVVTRTTPTLVSPSGVAGLRFVDEAETVNRQVALLRAQGIEAIVVVMHEGGQADLGDAVMPGATQGAMQGATQDAPATPGGLGARRGENCVNARGEGFAIVDKLDPAVDLVVAGHTHQAYNCVRNGIRVVQAGAFGRLLAEVDLRLDAKTGDVMKGGVTAYLLPVLNGLNADAASTAKYPPVPAHPAVAALVAHYAANAAPRINREVGRITDAFGRDASPGGDHAAGRLVADAQLAATQGKGRGDAQIAFMNPGGVRTDLTPVDALGAVSYGAVFRMQPFGNSLVTMSLSGAQIKALLEQQWAGANTPFARILQPSGGFEYAWRAGAPVGAKVAPESMKLNGVPIDAALTYRVTVNSFLAEGGDGFTVLMRGAERVGGAQDIDALLGWLRERSPVAPRRAARIERWN